MCKQRLFDQFLHAAEKPQVDVSANKFNDHHCIRPGSERSRKQNRCCAGEVAEEQRRREGLVQPIIAPDRCFALSASIFHPFIEKITVSQPVQNHVLFISAKNTIFKTCSWSSEYRKFEGKLTHALALCRNASTQFTSYR